MEAALTLGFADPEAHLNLSKTERSLGDAAAADEQLRIYQQAIKSKGDVEMATSKAAEAQQELEKGDATKAVALFHEALDATPNDAGLQYSLALALDRTGDLAGERTALDSAVRLQPTLALAQHQLGYLLSRNGDNSGAEEHFRLAVKDKPDFTQAWLSLAATLAMKSDYAGARDALNHALRLDPHNDQAQQMRRMLPPA